MPAPFPARIWKALRRDVMRGYSAAYHDYRTLPLIESWKWPYWSESPHHIPVHMVIGETNWRMAAWTLASWFCATDMGWPVVLHDDGTLLPHAIEVMQNLFGPHLVVHSRASADEAMNMELTAFPFCDEYRRTDVNALKLLDIAQFSAGGRCIVLDPDVLFFQKPVEMLAWVGMDTESCWFCEDAVERSIITVAEARDELGVKLWRRVDTGICLLWTAAIDLDFVDRALAQTSVLKGAPDRIASTLMALCASQHNVGGLLQKSYEVSLEGSMTSGAVARCYSEGTRPRFFAEGLRRLREPVLAVGGD